VAQADGVVANGTGAAVRSDLNGQLAALFTNHSGSTEPGTTYAYQFWADTNANVLKIRNSANNAWITLRELDGTMLMEDGTVSAPGLAFASDLNTGFFRSAADKINFATGGAERLEIGSSEVVFNDSGADVDLRVEGDAEANLLFVDAGNDRVGIGTSLPDAKLEVVDTASSLTYPIAVSNFTDPATDVGSAIDFRLTTAGNSRGYIACRYTSNSSADGTYLSFAPNDGSTGNVERLRIDSSGQVILNNSASSGDATVLRITGGTSGSSVIEMGDTADTDVGQIAYYQSSNAMAFRVNASEALRIDSSGNVGIGASAPAAKLDVAGNQLFSAANPQIQFNAGGPIIRVPSANTLAFLTDSSDERMRITSGGNVFIGDSSPTLTGRLSLTRSGFVQYNRCTGTGTGNIPLILERASDDGTEIEFKRAGSVVGNINVTSTTTNYVTSSDYRLKENVVDLDGAIIRVKQLAPKRFNFIADADRTVDGFLAHEAQIVVPEAVTGTQNEVDEDGNPIYQGIDQSKLVPLLTAALQEAIAKIETLETKVAALEAG